MPSNAGRGTTQDSQRRGSTNANAGRSQGKNQSTTSARNAAGRSGTSGTSTSQRQTSAGSQRGTAATSQSSQRGTAATSQSSQRGTSTTKQSKPIQDRSSEINRADIGQTQAASTISTESTTSQPSPTTRETATTSQADRELPMQSSRETGERETTPRGTTGQSLGRRASGQTAPTYGYGGGYPNPFMAVRRIMEDMDRLASNFGFGGGLFPPSLFGQDPFSSLRGNLGGSSGQGLQTLWSPQVDVFQRGDQIVIRADLPGLKKEDVNVEIDQNVLTIRGERRQEFEDDSEGVYRSERSYGSFQRSIPLPEGITADDAQASFTEGVLEIMLPTPKSQARSRKVQIR
jgi:HSP20 family protein